MIAGRDARARANAAARLAGLVIDRVLRGALLTPLLVRSLGLAAYGRYSTVISLLNLARPVVFGAAPAITGSIVRAPDGEAGLVRGAVAESLLLAHVLWAALVVGSAIAFRDRTIALVTALLGVQLVCDAVGLRGLSLHARMRDALLVGARTLSSLALLLAALAALALGGGVRAIAACLAGAALLETALVLRATPTGPRAPLGAFFKLPILRASAPAVALALLDGVGGNLEIVLLARGSDAAAAGALGALTRLYGVTWLLPSAIASALLPVFAAGGGDARARCERTVALLAAVGAPLAMFAPLYLALAPAILGERIAPALAIGPLLAWRIVCAFLHAPIGTYLVATGRQSAALKAALGGALVLAIGCAALIPRYGLAGAALSALAGEAVKLALYLGALGVASVRRLAASALVPLSASLLAFAFAAAWSAGPVAATLVATIGYALLLALAHGARRAPRLDWGRP